MRVRVTFGEHISPARVANMCSSMAAYGFVHNGATKQEFVVEVFRQSKSADLEETLTGWDVHGFVRWTREQQERSAQFR